MGRRPAIAQAGNTRRGDRSRSSVFIPVDEKEQPTNDKYQVPELLYDELQRARGRRFGHDRRVPGSRRATVPAFGQPRRDERRTRSDRRACAIRRARTPTGHGLAFAGHRRAIRPPWRCATTARSTWSGTRTRMASRAVSSSRGCISLTCRCEISVSRGDRQRVRYRDSGSTTGERYGAVAGQCADDRSSVGLRRDDIFGRRPYAVCATWSRGPLIPALGPRPPVAQPTDRW